jgi:hypothetical protein
MTNLNRFRRLPRVKRRLLLQSVLLLPVIHFSLNLIGYSRLRDVLEKMFPLKPGKENVSEPEIVRRGEEIAYIVLIAAQHGLITAGCLRRSILAWWFLRRGGIPSDICFGVRKCNHALEAHAWVEYHGRVLNDFAKIHEIYLPLKGALPSTKLGL